MKSSPRTSLNSLAVVVLGGALLSACGGPELAGEADVGESTQALGAFYSALPQRGANVNPWDHLNSVGPEMIKTIKVRDGAYIDAIQVFGYFPNSATNLSGTNTNTAWLGGTGGIGDVNFPFCPPGTAAVGLIGSADWIALTSLGLVCKQIDPAGSGLPVGNTILSSGVAGPGGGSNFLDVCPSGTWLGGLSFATYNLVSEIRGFCYRAR